MEEFRLDKEYLVCVRDILESEIFNSTEQYIQHGNTTCRQHSIQVSYLSYRICRKRGWDYRAAARAGLLHDLFLYDWHSHAKETGKHFHGFTHPRTAARNAESYFEVSPKEKEIILRHMWPLTLRLPMSGAGLAIVYADKVCSMSEISSRVRRWIPVLAGNNHMI